MHHITRTLLAVLAIACLLAGCGDAEKEAAARAKKLEDLKAQLKAHNAEYVVKQPQWQAIRNQVIPARNAWKAAKGTSEEAALKEAYEQLQAQSNETVQLEDAWDAKKRDLEAEIRKLGG